MRHVAVQAALVESPRACVMHCTVFGSQSTCKVGLSMAVGVMQEEGPTEADVSSLRNIEQRNWETLQQENTFWQEVLTTTYMSRTYQLVSGIYSY